MLEMRRLPKRFTPQCVHLGGKTEIILSDSRARELAVPDTALSTGSDGLVNPGQTCGYPFSVIHITLYNK